MALYQQVMKYYYDILKGKYANFRKVVAQSNYTELQWESTRGTSLYTVNSDFYSHFAIALRGTKITKVKLTHMDMGPLELDNFSRNLQGTNVSIIDLSSNETIYSGLVTFARNLRGTSVKKINLCSCGLDAKEAADFVRNLQGTSVTALNFYGNQFGAEGAVELARSLQGTNITTVGLGNNDLDSNGAADFVLNLQGTNVTHIILTHNLKINCNGAANIARNAKGTSLISVNLGGNNLGPDGAAEFAENLKDTNITEIILDGNSIGTEGAVKVIENLQGSNVATIDLACNQIESKKTGEIALRLQKTKITTFIAYRNRFGDDGAVNFARNLKGTKVETIDLQGNNLSHQGAAELVRHLQGTNVKTLDLSYNKIDFLEELAVNLRGTNIRFIDLSNNSLHSDEIVKFVRNLSGSMVSSAILRMRGLPLRDENLNDNVQKLIELIPSTNLTQISSYIDSPELTQALMQNKLRIEQERRAALEIAYSNHCNHELPTAMAYPQEQEHTQKGTQYAMGIIANLQDPVLIKKIIGYLPSIQGGRPAECMALVANRIKPTLKPDVVTHHKKRNKQEHGSHTKRQVMQARVEVIEPIQPQESNTLKRVNSDPKPAKRQRISSREVVALQMSPLPLKGRKR